MVWHIGDQHFGSLCDSVSGKKQELVNVKNRNATGLFRIKELS